MVIMHLKQLMTKTLITDIPQLLCNKKIYVYQLQYCSIFSSSIPEASSKYSHKATDNDKSAYNHELSKLRKSDDLTASRDIVQDKNTKQSSYIYKTDNYVEMEKSTRKDVEKDRRHMTLQNLLHAEPNRPSLELLVHSDDPVVQKTIDAISHMAPIGVVNTLKKMEQNEKRLIIWRAMSERCKQVVHQMEGDDVATAIHIFGLKRLRDADCLLILVEHILPKLPTITTDSLVQFLWGLARLKTRSDVAFKVAAREVAARANEMTVRQISTIFPLLFVHLSREVMFSYATLKYLHPYLHDVLRIQLIERARSLKPRDLTLTLQSLSLLKLQKDEKLFVSLVSQANRIIEEFSGSQLAAVLNSYANFGIKHALCLEIITKEIFHKVNELEPMNVAAVINAAARLPPMNNGLLITQLADKLSIEGYCYGLDALCLATSGLSTLQARITTLRPRINPLFQSLGRRIGELSMQLQPRQVASLAEVHFGPLFFHAPIHLRRFSSYYSCDSIAMIVRSYAKLDLRCEPVIEVLMMSLPRFVVPFDDYPLKHLTTKYLQARKIVKPCFQLNNISDTEFTSKITLSDVDSWKMRSPEAAEVKVGAPPRPISLIWILETFAQWNIVREEALSMIANQLTLRSCELSPPLCVRALTAWQAFNMPGAGLAQSLLKQIEISWNEYSRHEKSSLNRHQGKKDSTNSKKHELESETTPLTELLGINVIATEKPQLRPNEEMKNNPPHPLFVIPSPLSWRQGIILLNVVRKLGYRPREVLPESLLSFARQGRCKLLEKGLSERWDVSSKDDVIHNIIPTDSIRRIEESNKQEIERFNSIIETPQSYTNRSSTVRKKQQHATAMPIGHIPCSSRPNREEIEQQMSEWDFKTSNNIIRENCKIRRKGRKEQRKIFLDKALNTDKEGNVECGVSEKPFVNMQLVPENNSKIKIPLKTTQSYFTSEIDKMFCGDDLYGVKIQKHGPDNNNMQDTSYIEDSPLLNDIPKKTLCLDEIKKARKTEKKRKS